MSRGDFVKCPTALTGCQWTAADLPFRLQRIVYARHGREVIGYDSTVFDPAFDMSSGRM